jgi:hypothetical protein
LFSLATSVLAANGKKDTQAQPQPTEQSQTAQTGADSPKDQAAANDGCTVKPKKHSRQKQQRTEPQSDVNAWQPEYGGGG